MDLKNKKGLTIPQIGLGTYPFQGRDMADMVLSASKIGYRLFDTADDYRGEVGIGIGLSEIENKIGLSREDLFIQTKISDNNAYLNEPLKGIFFNPYSKFMRRHTVDEIVREKVEKSLRDLKTDYLDSLLIHYPFPGYTIDIWKTMIDLKNEGLVRYIGVSNFHEYHIMELIENTGVSPEINEIYTSPIGTKQSIVDFCQEHGCRVHTYSPLMSVAQGKIPLEKISPIACKYGKSVAQIVLRWNLDRGCIPLPKTKNISRLKENFDIFDFKLDENEISFISSFNYDYQYLVESKTCPGI